MLADLTEPEVPPRRGLVVLGLRLGLRLGRRGALGLRLIFGGLATLGAARGALSTGLDVVHRLLDVLGSLPEEGLGHLLEGALVLLAHCDLPLRRVPGDDVLIQFYRKSVYFDLKIISYLGVVLNGFPDLDQRADDILAQERAHGPDGGEVQEGADAGESRREHTGIDHAVQ